MQLVKFFKEELTESDQDLPSKDTPWQGPVMTDSLKILASLPQQGHRQIKQGLSTIRKLENRRCINHAFHSKNLLRQSQPQVSYEGREVLQTLRLVKAYGLSKDPQLEILAKINPVFN